MFSCSKILYELGLLEMNYNSSGRMRSSLTMLVVSFFCSKSESWLSQKSLLYLSTMLLASDSPLKSAACSPDCDALAISEMSMNFLMMAISSFVNVKMD